MSENILKALTQLFGLITKQDGGATKVERTFVIDYFKNELDQESVNSYTTLYDEVSDYDENRQKIITNKPMAMRESVRVLRFCREINKSLEQRQKVIILVKLLELISSDENFTPQRREVIDTVASSFKIQDDYKAIESFVMSTDSSQLNQDNVLVVSNNDKFISPEVKHWHMDIKGEIIFKRVETVDLYFVKYIGNEQFKANGFAMKTNQVYLFPNGSSIKTENGLSVYYGDVISIFLEKLQDSKLSFIVKDLVFEFPNGAIGIQPLNLSEPQGKLLGIMGGSGAGKTTLMNVLAGIEYPSKGTVEINGIDIHKDKDKIEGVIGYIAQDDLLIEELTVYQNLYYNAKLCFKDLKEAEIDERVMTTLSNLGLDHIKDLKVGNVLNKKISGGQRKRLNIALELIREPAVMFVDEPTSGLSSKDSQNVIDLLKELSLKGKLIFVVIHQPSSEIYKTFDKMIILDKGGYLIYYGNPIDAITYFKVQTNQADSGKRSENPEELFNLIEKEVIDEFGRPTGKRQTTPKEWYERYNSHPSKENVEIIQDSPPSSLKRPSIFNQTVLFTVRDLLAKVSNQQYMLINLLEAPLLAILLSFVIRFQNEPDTGDYVYRYNDNIPAYILICIIISMFMGLTVSAEEIIKDKKIQKRERFLNLSRFGYLFSKIIILFLLSAVQTLCFVFIGNSILEVQGEFFTYWLILFAISCFSNVLGLNISSTFNSVITIYITIPLLLIPQMILSGIIFRYEKMNTVLTEKGKVPLVADIMVSRWAFEAIMVRQYISNPYEADYYSLDKKISENDYKVKFWIPELLVRVNRSLDNINKSKKTDSLKKEIENDLTLIRNEIQSENFRMDILDGFSIKNRLKSKGFDEQVAERIRSYFDSIKTVYVEKLNEANKDRDDLVRLIQERRDSTYDITKYKNRYFNEGQDIFVTNIEIKDRYIEDNGRIIQQINPIFNEPKPRDNPFAYRTHFMSPKKPFFGSLFDTYNFNTCVIWFFTLLLFITLYFDFFKFILELFSKLSFKKGS